MKYSKIASSFFTFLMILSLTFITIWGMTACQPTPSQTESTEENGYHAETNGSTDPTSATNREYDSSAVSANQFPQDVSIYQLLGNPEKYDEQFVRVIGVGNLEFEGNCLCPTKEDWKYATGNSIAISLDARVFSAEEYTEFLTYNGEYVILEGIFDKDEKGHMGMHHGTIRDISRYDLWNIHQITHAMIVKDLDGTYSYEITDYNGRCLAQVDNITKEIKRQYVSTDVVGIVMQAGMGLATNCATYYDLENSAVSETFYYVLAARNGYVLRADQKDGKHWVVVQDIFDQEGLYREYPLENVSPAADFVVEGSFDAQGNICITYLSGADHTSCTITLPFN